MNNYLQLNSIEYAVKELKKKKIIFYPTETVFGIGCDPDSEIAVNYLLKFKKRPIEKGLILIASDFKQLQPYIDDSFLCSKKWKLSFLPTKFTSINHHPITFIFPIKISTPSWLTGNFNSLAVRVSNHPTVIKLCNMFGKPIVSTSANFTGYRPCRTKKEIYEQFGNIFPIADGEIFGYRNPSEIRNILTGKCLRKG